MLAAKRANRFPTTRWAGPLNWPTAASLSTRSHHLLNCALVCAQPSDETYDRIVFTYNKDGTLATRTDQNGSVLTWSYDALRRKTEEEVTTVGSATGYNVDSAVRAVTWTYTSDGLTEFVTTHSDTTPDTSTWTDAVNQVKYTYDAANRLTEEEQEPDGAVDGSTLSVQYAYGTDYSTGNYARANKITYPDGKILWNGYTHTDTANTFEDTVNDAFSRVGQLSKASCPTREKASLAAVRGVIQRHRSSRPATTNRGRRTCRNRRWRRWARAGMVASVNDRGRFRGQDGQ